MNGATSVDRLFTVEDGTTAQAVTRLLAVLFPDAGNALDATYGNGRFWDRSARVVVTGLDLMPERAAHVAGDFRALPFKDGAFDVVLFDPPFQTDMGRGKASIMGRRFKTFDTVTEMRAAVEQGAREAWRVARLGVIAKVQDYIHASRPVWMSDYVKGAMPVEPYDVLYLRSPSKVIDPKWSRQLSVWRNHSTFWVWRKDGVTHRGRPGAPSAVVGRPGGWTGGEGRLEQTSFL